MNFQNKIIAKALDKANVKIKDKAFANILVQYANLDKNQKQQVPIQQLQKHQKKNQLQNQQKLVSHKKNNLRQHQLKELLILKQVRLLLNNKFSLTNQLKKLIII